MIRKIIASIFLMGLISIVGHSNNTDAENDAYIFEGKRWEEGEDKAVWYTIPMPDGGVRIYNNNTKQEYLAIDSFGGIYLNGDVYLNGEPLNDKLKILESTNFYERDDVILLIASIILIFLSIFIILVFWYKKSQESLLRKYSELILLVKEEK